jgi:hypothetical protein
LGGNETATYCPEEYGHNGYVVVASPFHTHCSDAAKDADKEDAHSQGIFRPRLINKRIQWHFEQACDNECLSERVFSTRKNRPFLGLVAALVEVLKPQTAAKKRQVSFFRPVSYLLGLAPLQQNQ